MVETQRTQRDTRTGVESLIIERKIGNKSRKLVRQRDMEGNEEIKELLEGMTSGIVD